MATCPTCRGEYTRSQCPVCGVQLGARNSVLCHACGAELGKCPRCQRDISSWEEEQRQATLVSFLIRQGGLLAIAPSLGIAALVQVVVLLLDDNPLHHFTAPWLAVGLSLLVFMSLYGLRYRLREADWGRQVFQVAWPRPELVSGLAMLAALGGGLFCVVLYKEWTDPHFYHKLFFGLAYGATHASLTLSLTLVSLLAYSDRLDRRVPQPIFMHTDQLANEVIGRAAGILQARSRSQAPAGSQSEALVSLEVMGVSRDPLDGAIRLAVREYRCVQRMDQEMNLRPQWIEGTWTIEADRWGRICRLEPNGADPKDSRALDWELEDEPAPASDLFALAANGGVGGWR